MTPDQRKQIIQALTKSDLNKLKEVQTIVSGSKLVLSTFLDALMYTSLPEGVKPNTQVEITGELADFLSLYK